jgi:hypothetical protein
MVMMMINVGRLMHLGGTATSSSGLGGVLEQQQQQRRRGVLTRQGWCTYPSSSCSSGA